MEIIETGALRRVDAERTEDVAAVQLFQGIYGVGMDYNNTVSHCYLPPSSNLPPPGQSTAYAWYFAGCRTLEDIKERNFGIELSQAQVLGLKYYDGALLHRMGWIIA
jgi:DNA polymerase lambda